MMIRMNAFTPVPKTDDTAPASAGGAPGGAAMTDAIGRLAAAEHRSTAEMLQELRRVFPHSPLAVRVRALDQLRKR
jgi:hypothetical protein